MSSPRSSTRRRAAPGQRAKPEAQASAAKGDAKPEARRRTQAERTALSDARMMRAAVKLIAERGYRDASLAAIGEEAGYSRGLVSHRFGSKEGLLRALVRSMVERWSEARRDPAMAGHDGLEAVRAMVRSHRDALREAPLQMRALYKLMFESHGELAPLRDEFTRIDAEQRALLVALLRAGQKQKTVSRRVRPHMQAVVILGAVRGIVMQWLLDPEGMDVARVYAELDASLVRSLSPE